MEKNKSIEIYSELIIGKYVNKSVINSLNQFVDNPLYQEIDKDIYGYENFYDVIGYSLIHNIEYGYFYLSKQTFVLDDEKELDKNVIREYVLSVCLCRYVLDKRKSLSLFFNPEEGLTAEDISDFLQTKKFERIFMTSEINIQTNPIQTIFERRNIFLKNTSGNYIGTAIFKNFVDSQESLGKLIIEDSTEINSIER